MKKAMMLVALTVAQTFGQQFNHRFSYSGELELYENDDKKQYLSLFLWEDSKENCLRFMQRFYPATGRPLRMEAGAGCRVELKSVRIGKILKDVKLAPVFGAATDGYWIGSVVLSGQVYRFKVTYVFDKKTVVTAGRPGFLFQKTFVSLNKWDLRFRWEGIRQDTGKWTASQWGIEWFPKRDKRRLTPFIASQFDTAAHAALVHTGIRF